MKTFLREMRSSIRADWHKGDKFEAAVNYLLLSVVTVFMICFAVSLLFTAIEYPATAAVTAVLLAAWIGLFRLVVTKPTGGSKK